MSLCLALCWLFLVLRARSWEMKPEVEGVGNFIQCRVCWTIAVTLAPENSSPVAGAVCEGCSVPCAGSWLGGVPVRAEQGCVRQ